MPNETLAELARALFERLAQGLVAQMQLSLVQVAGRTPGRNSLSQSNLVKSFEYQLTDAGIVILANDYWRFVESGRARGVKRVPFDAIYFWAKRYGIKPRTGQTFNGMVFAIREGIFKNGIRPRPFVDAAVTNALKLLEEPVNKALRASIENAFRTTS